MSAQDSAPIRVFLIDDHRTILWGLERLIETGKPAMRVVGSATSYTEALKLLDAAAPDVIVLDIDLGKESGLDAIPWLIAASAAKILVLTGLRDSSVHDKAVLAGARGVVEKEASADTILTAIAKVHEGQLWLDRAATGRVFVEFSRKGATPPPIPSSRRSNPLPTGSVRSSRSPRTTPAPMLKPLLKSCTSASTRCATT